MAEVLERLAEAPIEESNPDREAELTRRIKELEDQVAKLTAQLQDKEKTLEAAQAVRPFSDSYKQAAGKSLGEATGKIAERLSLFIPMGTLLHFFGPNHETVKLLVELLKHYRD